MIVEDLVKVRKIFNPTIPDGNPHLYWALRHRGHKFTFLFTTELNDGKQWKDGVSDYDIQKRIFAVEDYLESTRRYTFEVGLYPGSKMYAVTIYLRR